MKMLLQKMFYKITTSLESGDDGYYCDELYDVMDHSLCLLKL